MVRHEVMYGVEASAYFRRMLNAAGVPCRSKVSGVNLYFSLLSLRFSTSFSFQKHIRSQAVPTFVTLVFALPLHAVYRFLSVPWISIFHSGPEEPVDPIIEIHSAR
jgi:hypothetical protein